QAVASWFKQLHIKSQPDGEVVPEQAPPLGKVDAGAIVQAIDDAKPDAIFNVLFGADLAKLVREGTTRGTFKNRVVVSLLSGEPEYLDPLKDEAPVGWIVTGYPWEAINTPAHKAFVAAYQKRWNDYPRLGSVVGYDTINSLAAGITKAGSTDTDKLVAAFRGLRVEGPFGPFQFRANDHQATLGAYVGKIALKDGKGTMSDFKYVDGASVLPSDEEVKKLRRACSSWPPACRSSLASPASSTSPTARSTCWGCIWRRPLPSRWAEVSAFGAAFSPPGSWWPRWARSSRYCCCAAFTRRRSCS